MANKLAGLNSYQKRFMDIFYSLTHRHNSWQIWTDFTTIAACAISNCIDTRHREEREKLYMDTIQKYERDELLQFPKLIAATVDALDDNPEQDYLGVLFQLLELSSHWHGQFFTPYSVCEMIATTQTEGLAENVTEKGTISVNDPACGAGALLIAFANVSRKQGINYQNHILFVGQDIDHTAAMMCYIQLSLLGCPGYVIVGDTLRHPPTIPLPKGYEIWYTPLYCSSVWHWRRTFKALDAVIGCGQAQLEGGESK